jgi:16S rRNA (adenine1518-N6/adenine1519-N6)-dimethyltransferase
MNINYNSAADLRSFLDKNGLGMRKKLGQNFLINPATRQALVSALEAEVAFKEGAGNCAEVWEIGPGLGAMTSLLLERGFHVRAFEIDPGFIRILKELFADNAGFTLIEGDVLKTWQTQPPAPYLLANLPYNIAAALLAAFIEQRRFFKRMVITVQREIARRMAASPGSADYSSFSVLCASAYRVKPLMLIKGASFYPKPNVDSQGVLLELREDAVANVPPACFYPLVRRLFMSRRKTIKNNLGDFFTMKGNSGSPAAMASLALEKSFLDGGRRAEELALEDFTVFAKTIEDMGKLP